MWVQTSDNNLNNVGTAPTEGKADGIFYSCMIINEMLLKLG